MKPALHVVIALLGALLALNACALPEEALPGRPCDDSDDCGAAFSCVRVPGREDNICAPKPPPEEVVGCAGQGDGSPCGDGDGCTEDDTCRGGVCAGVAKDCGGDVCVDGVCQVVSSCEEQAPRVVAGGAAVPRVAYNPLDDEVGVLFEATVANRVESFFVRVGSDGVPRGAPLQLTDGTPPTVEDGPVSSFARDIAFAPEEQTYGIIVDSNDLLGGVAYTSVTRDGIQSSGVNSIITSLLAAFVRAPARMDWNGSRFYVAAIQNGSQTVSVVLDAVDADGSGESIGNDTLADGSFGAVDIAASRRSGELGVVFTRSGVDNVAFIRANLSGTVLVERTLSTGRPTGVNPAIDQTDEGYVVVWQEEDPAAGRQVVGVLVGDDGAARGAVRVLSDPSEAAQLPAVASTGAGALLVYFASADGTFETRSRSLAADLNPAAPQTVRGLLVGGYAPTADAAGGTVVIGYGVSDADGNLGDVELARVCEP